MRANNIESDRELQQVLWACYDFWRESRRPPPEREIWYGWIRPRYEERFETKFHQSKLRRLAKLGFLEKGDTARAGRRRYYKIVNPDQVSKRLEEWGF